MDLQFIQSIAGSLTLGAAVLYLVGGLIVNIHLGKYRITEYQIVSIHYLVVGLVFLLRLSIFVIPITLPAAVIAVFSNAGFLAVSIVAAVLSLLAGMVIMTWIALLRQLSRPLKINGVVEAVVNLLLFLYPLSVIIRLNSPEFSNGVLWWEKQAATGLISFALFVYGIDYAVRVYGAPVDENMLRIGGSIGRGIPQLVQLAGTQNDMKLLAELGVPLKNPQLSEGLYLIDETLSQYIVTCGIDKGSEAIKINKDMVRALRYRGF